MTFRPLNVRPPSFAKQATATGFTRVFNGGGCHIHTKELANGWTLSACNGRADEVKPTDTRFHLNACRTDDCEQFVPGFWVKVAHAKRALMAWENVVLDFSEDQT